MSLTEKYPYTNFAGVNLDYILDELNKLKDSGNYPSAYIHTIEVSDDGIITFKNGLGEAVATVDTIQKAIKDPNEHDITTYLYNVGYSKELNNLTFMRGAGTYKEIQLPTFALIAYADEDDPNTYIIDNTSYEDYEDFLDDVNRGRPCRLVLKEDSAPATVPDCAVPVYKSGSSYFIELWIGSSWKCFALSFASSGTPEVQTVTLTQVNT